MNLDDHLAVLDQVDWTASGAERWLATAPIAALGLLSISTQAIYLDQTTSLATSTLLVPAMALVLAVIVILAALWLPRSGYGLYLPRIALWSVIGAIVLVAVGQLVILSQQLLGDEFTTPLFILGYMQTAGTAIGLVIGFYDASSERTKRDLDEQRKRAERYSQQLTVLNRILRHDVRTDVQIIRDYAEMLPDPDGMEPTIPLDHIRTRAQAMYETAESARELQSLMGDRNQMSERQDISAQIDSAIEVVRSSYPEAEFNLAGQGSVTVTASRIVDLAFKELITNAVEHNDSESPNVDIRVGATAQAVFVHIADNGPGIPEWELEPLRRGGETALTHSSGIGLWLANWIVGVTDGSLSFEGNDAGGSVVTVRLPT